MVLIGDIDRGGVIASLVGTKVVIDPTDAALIRSFIVNRFRGDPALFADGMARIVSDRLSTVLGQNVVVENRAAQDRRTLGRR